MNRYISKILLAAGLSLFFLGCGDGATGSGMCGFPLELTLVGVKSGTLDFVTTFQTPEMPTATTTCHCEVLDGKWTCAGDRFCNVPRDADLTDWGSGTPDLKVMMDNPKTQALEEHIDEPLQLQVTWNGQTRGGLISTTTEQRHGDLNVNGEWRGTCPIAVADVDFSELDEVPQNN